MYGAPAMMLINLVLANYLQPSQQPSQLFSFKKLLKKHSHLSRYVTYHNLWRVLKPYNLDDSGVYFPRKHFSLHLTFLFFMDLTIFFSNLDSSQSLHRFTCLTILEWPRNSLAQDGARPQQGSSLHGKFCLKFY